MGEVQRCAVPPPLPTPTPTALQGFLAARLDLSTHVERGLYVLFASGENACCAWCARMCCLPRVRTPAVRGVVCLG